MNAETTIEDLGRETSRAEFLNLTPEDDALIAIRLALHRKLRETRLASGLTQTALAERIGSSQSRVAKAESGHPEISLELLIRATIAGGASAVDIANAIRETANVSKRTRRTKAAA
jgi:DNA-binding XRE family transcriptional regulator